MKTKTKLFWLVCLCMLSLQGYAFDAPLSKEKLKTYYCPPGDSLTALGKAVLEYDSTSSTSSLYLEFGKNTSKFKYKNSDDESIGNFLPKQNVNLRVGYQQTMGTDRLHWNLGLAFTSYGSEGMIDGNYLHYQLNYTELEAGIQWDIITFSKLRFYLLGQAAIGLLNQGTQEVNGAVLFEVKQNSSFSDGLYRLSGGVGIAYQVNKDIGVYLHYLGGGAADIEKQAQSVRIINHIVGLGLHLSL